VTNCDPPDFAALYNQYRDSIHRYCYRRVTCPELAEDLTQDVFCKALAAVRRGVEVQHISGWLYRIARNLIIDYYRKRDKAFVGSFDAMTSSVGRQDGTQAVWGTLDTDHFAVDPSDLEAEVIDRLTLADGLRYVAHVVSPPQATVFALRADGYTFAEIAGMLDTTPGAAKRLRTRCYASLRERMTP
jgi:RNA polymerase sigma-70 factor (ECF subfamily)